MIMSLYSLKDVKACEFSGPILMHESNVGRFCGSLVATKGSDYNLYTSDFELWKIGTFDNATGLITSDVSFISNLSNLPEVKYLKREGVISEEGSDSI